MVPDHIFQNLWRIIYWTSQFLTWLIMPLIQSYLKAGDFTIKGKLKAALIDNAIYYGSYLFICGILLIYLALKPGVYLDWPKLKAIASSASNTWGLFLLILLLGKRERNLLETRTLNYCFAISGYALVEVPRSLWNHSKPGITLQYAYFKLAKLSSDKAEAEENVDDVLESLQAASRATPLNHPIRPCIETIIRKVPTELMDRANRNVNRGDSAPATAAPSEKALVRLHKQVIKSLQTLQRTEALWGVQVARVLHLEDVDRNMQSMDQHFKTEFPQQRTRFNRIFNNPTIEWYWYCLIKPPFLRSLAVVTGALSLMVVWSELTFFNRKPVLSIFANVVILAKENYDFLTIELFSMATLCYLCYCAYSTVFRIKFLNLYYLAPHHQTNEHSLIFSGMLLCRLTPPMCLNFLGLIHMDSHIIKKRISETYYTQVMGHMDVLGIISDGFNIYFPMVMLAFCLATWFSLGSRTLNALGFQQFMLNESISAEIVQEGRDLIGREKRRRQRSEEAQTRRREQQLSMRGSGNGISKYRTTGSAGNRLDMTREPSDGLLRDSEMFDYSTTTRNTDIVSSLSDEINERFGTSTSVKVGFKGYDFGDSDSDDVSNQRHTGGPPRHLFDDV